MAQEVKLHLAQQKTPMCSRRAGRLSRSESQLLQSAALRYIL
jgi:hypothetical protein